MHDGDKRRRSWWTDCRSKRTVLFDVDNFVREDLGAGRTTVSARLNVRKKRW